MNKWIGILLLLLSASFALNLYLLSITPKPHLTKQLEHKNSQAQQNSLPESLFNWNFIDGSKNKSNQTPSAINSSPFNQNKS
jgi:hypothetical protein